MKYNYIELALALVIGLVAGVIAGYSLMPDKIVLKDKLVVSPCPSVVCSFNASSCDRLIIDKKIGTKAPIETRQEQDKIDRIQGEFSFITTWPCSRYSINQMLPGKKITSLEPRGSGCTVGYTLESFK